MQPQQALAHRVVDAVPQPSLTLVSSHSPSVDTRHSMDLHDCESLMRTGSKTFFAASLVLPSRVRGPATALYAFCRLADDTIDLESHLHGGPMGALHHLQQRLQRIYDGCPSPVPADRALSAVVTEFSIPKALLDALLEGFEWDLQARRYETIAQLHDYGARVAGTVGSMMAIIMGARGPQAQARACELGLAMQLTNIARDVGEDARNGRLYLPREWMREAGIDPDAWLRAPTFSPALGSVVARLLAEADTLYERAALGIPALPRDCRPAIQAARLVYADIGREVERAGFDSVSRRACVSSQRKLGLMAVAFGAAAHVTGTPPERGNESDHGSCAGHPVSGRCSLCRSTPVVRPNAPEASTSAWNQQDRPRKASASISGSCGRSGCSSASKSVSSKAIHSPVPAVQAPSVLSG
jgi:15-cis-phytoene synthase